MDFVKISMGKDSYSEYIMIFFQTGWIELSIREKFKMSEKQAPVRGTLPLIDTIKSVEVQSL